MDLEFISSSLLLKLAAIFGSSIAGSLHCIAMCGGLAVSAGVSKSEQLAYHISRGGGYLALGLLAGLAGSAFQLQDFPPELEVLFSISLFVLLVISGAKLILKKNISKDPPSLLASMLGSLSSRGFRAAGKHPSRIVKSALYGSLTALIPCGWLYSFLLIAAAAPNVLQSVLIMFVFWLGTLPALVTGRQLIQFAARTLGQKWGVISARGIGIAFILLGFYSFYERISHMDHSKGEHWFHWLCQ